MHTLFDVWDLELVKATWEDTICLAGFSIHPTNRGTFHTMEPNEYYALDWLNMIGLEALSPVKLNGYCCIVIVCPLDNNMMKAGERREDGNKR